MREVEERHYEFALDTVDDQHGSPDVFPGNGPPPAVGVVTPDRSWRAFDLDALVMPTPAPRIETAKKMLK
jgi:hypothetical protein